MLVRPRLSVMVLLTAGFLAGCGNNAVKPVPQSAYNESINKGGGARGGTLFGPQGLVLGIGGKNGGGNNAGAALGVNAYLWRGALDTLSFMPLASADPFGGVIITDWYQPPSSPGERFKATTYILGRQLRADGVRVSVFRQVMQGGQWVDAPVSPNTNVELENKILARARELRIRSATN